MSRSRIFLYSVFFIFLIGSVQIPSRAHAGEQTKPAADSSKTKDAPEAGFVVDIIERFNILKNFVCPEVAPPPIVVAPPKPRRIKPPVVAELPSEAFKSEGELRQYIECYTQSKNEIGRYQIVAKEYLPVIDVLSKTYHLPKTTMACLIFKESRFNKDATSYRINAKGKKVPNAYGLGQHIGDQIDTINDIINEPLQPPASDVAILKRLGQIDRGEGPKETTQDTKNRKHINSKNELRELRRTWEAGFDALRARGLYKGPTPHRLTPALMKENPIFAMAATHFSFERILLHIRNTVDSDVHVNNGDTQSPNYDLMLAAAGMYNVGEVAGAKSIGKLPDPGNVNIKLWPDALAQASREIAKHILSIRNCMESPSTKGGNAWANFMEGQDENCVEQAKGAKRVVSPIVNELPARYMIAKKTSAGVSPDAVGKKPPETLPVLAVPEIAAKEKALKVIADKKAAKEQTKKEKADRKAASVKSSTKSNKKKSNAEEVH